ncbi:MAG: hypothetical protein WBA59_06810 [Moheibacter sp.]
MDSITAKTKSIVDEVRTTGKYNENEELEIWGMIEGFLWSLRNKN